MKKVSSAKDKPQVSKRTIALLGDELNFSIPIEIFRVTRELAFQHNYTLL